jgi:predicted P-loop ATPase
MARNGQHGSKPSNGDVKSTVKFLEKLRPDGPWILTAIHPDKEWIDTITAKNVDEVRAFVQKFDGKRNLYYSVNPTRTAMTSKAAKPDIAAIEYVLADLDPKEGETSEAAKARYLPALKQYKPSPTAFLDSGNGIQSLWRLATPIKLSVWEQDGNKLKSPEQATIDKAEACAAKLMADLGGKAGTQNIDRILRLPGTTNLPNAKKRKDGRVERQAKLIAFNDATCALDDFPAASTGSGGSQSSANAGANTTIDWAKVEEHAGWLKIETLDKDLPDKFSNKGKMIIAHGGNLSELVFDLMHASPSLLTKAYGSWSEVSFALTAILKGDGRFTNEKIAAALMCPLDCNRHITAMKDVNTQRRAVERLLLRSYDQTQQQKKRHAPGQPDWREQRANGSPLPSMHNARLAILALSITCSYDTFHNKMTFGYDDEKTKHVIESVLGEVTDNGIIALRQILSDQFGFDLTDKHVIDAVKSIALEHCFDPVADMLDEAEANWDGKKRLDMMAVNNFNCENTKLNKTCIRKMMIAGVARVRQPGCKFDNITVLESEEGYNKSSAWQVLAGKENFSDEKIIGKDSREVQEQLAEVWIHENADLAGMKKADVETVKTFASRTEDRARPAFGHFLKKQKRHSIEVGTTNSDEYLASQTGNRRFWSMKVLKMIDLDKLQKDRLQLWGEAAHHESEGESLVLDEKLWGDAAAMQEERRVKDPWEDVLAEIPREIDFDFFEFGHHASKEIKIIHRYAPDNDWTEERVASSDLLTYVLKVPIGQQETRHTMKLASTMKHLGWHRYSGGQVTINNKQVKGYFRMVKNA